MFYSYISRNKGLSGLSKIRRVNDLQEQLVCKQKQKT